MDEAVFGDVRLTQGGCHKLACLLDHLAIMIGIDKTAGYDIRPSGQLAFLLIQCNDHHDDAVTRKEFAVAQDNLGIVAQHQAIHITLP